ncbi:MAG TPA: hypothetical protein VFJ72_10940 [Rubrobacteraceae bacterium]|nr:hypothetical protein [Rubrobacteraceae bacterium]
MPGWLKTLLRWTALFCVPGGVLWSLSPLGVHLSEWKYKTPNVFWKLFPSVPLLLMVGLVGLYFWTRGRHRLSWEIGFWVTLLGLILVFIGDTAEFWLGVDDTYLLLAPAYRTFRLGLLVLAVGSILFGASNLRSGTLPRWISLPFAVGSVGVLVAVSKDIGTVGAALWVAYGICWVWIGLGLLLEALISFRRKKRAGY